MLKRPGPRRHTKGLGYVPWWEWQKGKRPPGWTPADEARWRGEGPWPPFPKDRSELEQPDTVNGPAMQELFDRIDAREQLEYARGFKHLMLASTREIYLALNRGEAVPIDLLRREWVKRYGLRRK